MGRGIIKAGRMVSRRVGAGIVLLSALSALLLVTTIWLFGNLDERQQRVAQSVREDALWAAYQTEREAGQLVASILSAPKGAVDDVTLHYDLLYSRIGLLRGGKFAITFEHSDSVADCAEMVAEGVLALMPVMDAIVENPAKFEGRRASLLDGARAVQHAANELLMATNAAINTLRVDERNQALATYWSIGAAVSALTLVLVLIVVLLAVQLVHISRSGREMELLSQRNARSAKRAQAASAAKSSFLATMSHEIRTPLNGIIGMADVLSASPLSADQQEKLNIIRQSGDVLLDVINDILDYSKLEAGAMPVDPRDFVLDDMMGSIRTIMEPRANAAGLSITFAAPQLRLTSDMSRLRQILINFVGNAIKFTPMGSIRVTARVEKDRLICSVTDTGPGIAERDMLRLFREFSQLDSSNTRVHGGTGLGLAINKRLAEALGGKVGVDSEPGLGSTFWVDVPVTDIKPATSPELPQAIHLDTTLQGEVLVVDDNAVNRSVAGALLDHMGLSVSYAANGEEALAAMAGTTFALVLMDMQMPVLDGVEATRRARAAGVTTPIVGLSANAFDTDRAACLAAGMNAFIAKPVTRQKLAAALGPGVAPMVGPEPAPAQGPGVDVVYQQGLVEELGQPVFDDLVQRFRQDAGALIAEAASMQAADRDRFDSALHTLKGAALTLGFQALAQSAEQMRRGDFNPNQLEAQLPKAA